MGAFGIFGYIFCSIMPAAIMLCYADGQITLRQLHLSVISSWAERYKLGDRMNNER